MQTSDNALEGWHYTPPETASLLAKVLHNGLNSGGSKVVQLDRNEHSSYRSVVILSCILMDFSGKTIKLEGFLSTKDVKGFAGLLMSEIGYKYSYKKSFAFSNMHKKNLHGTTGWKKYSITLPHKPQARQLQFGVMLVGKGKVQVSQLQLLVDGKPIWKAPEAKLPETAHSVAYQFDQGSGIVIKKLSKIQVSNLVTLGKVWGFLKYYDRTITSGQKQWDYSLLRILPKILDAKDRKSANTVLVHWIEQLGPIAPCKRCVRLKTKNIQLRPDLDWIDNQNRLGKRLSEQLHYIRDNRRKRTQFYVTLKPNLGKPIFEYEPAYSSIRFPDSGFQLLALYRFWNIIEYWYPYRNAVGENWDRVLTNFIPRLALAKTRKRYILQLMALIAKAHDSHANLWSSLKLRPPIGSCHLPVRLRFVQNQPVVTKYMDGVQASTSPLQIGDVIVKLNGEPISRLVKEWAPYYGASNKAALKRDIATYMTRGICGYTTVEIRRDNHIQSINAKRVPLVSKDLSYGTRDLPGPAFRLLSPQVAYLKLSSAKASKMTSYINQAADAKGLIIDLRNESSRGALLLAEHLIDKPTPFARFTVPDLTNPGAFYWKKPVSLTPQKPYYKGKVMALVDSVTQSHAEFTAMALRAAGAIVVGSTTAGADGNMSRIELPGGLLAYISGLGVFYPDKHPTQRVGVVPDVVVKPTISGIRAGRDQVLEKAIRLILGHKPTIALLHKMYGSQPGDNLPEK